MPVPIEAVTTTALSAALETASRRHAAVAANIANAHTEGYAPLRIADAFGARVADARAMLHDKGTLDMAAAAGLRGELQAAPMEPGVPALVQVDAEMAEMARNAVQFQALVQGLSRHLGLLAMAAADGRR